MKVCRRHNGLSKSWANNFCVFECRDRPSCSIRTMCYWNDPHHTTWLSLLRAAMRTAARFGRYYSAKQRFHCPAFCSAFHTLCLKATELYTRKILRRYRISWVSGLIHLLPHGIALGMTVSVHAGKTSYGSHFSFRHKRFSFVDFFILITHSSRLIQFRETETSTSLLISLKIWCITLLRLSYCGTWSPWTACLRQSKKDGTRSHDWANDLKRISSCTVCISGRWSGCVSRWQTQNWDRVLFGSDYLLWSYRRGISSPRDDSLDCLIEPMRVRRLTERMMHGIKMSRTILPFESYVGFHASRSIKPKDGFWIGEFGFEWGRQHRNERLLLPPGHELRQKARPKNGEWERIVISHGTGFSCIRKTPGNSGAGITGHLGRIVELTRNQTDCDEAISINGRYPLDLYELPCA